MTVLIVRTKVPAVVTHHQPASLQVFASPAMPAGGITPWNLTGTTGKVSIAAGRTTARLLVTTPSAAIAPIQVSGSNTLSVFRASTELTPFHWSNRTLQVFSKVTDVGAIRPIDANRLVTEPGTKTELTSVMLDLGVSFDTFFKFDMMSLDGIRVVLDDDDKPIAGASDNSYALSNFVPGNDLKRTILTNNDFRVVLNIKPTIVKSVN